MSWLDIFKKVFEGEKEKSAEIPIKQASLAEIPYVIQEELKAREIKLEEMKKQALEKIEKFKLDLEMDIKVLENINLEKRKENEKLKLTVLDNLRLYIDYLKNLIKDLDSIKELSPVEYLAKASKLIENFTKNSKSAYEKATVLIGDDLGRVKDTVKSFLITISAILNSSKMIKEETDSINITRKTYERAEEIKRNIEELEKANSELKNLIENTKNKEEETKKEIEGARKSQEFKNSEQEKEKVREEFKLLDLKIQEVKDKIDLKLLSKHVHNDLRKSSLIQKYIDNFKEEMKADKDSSLVEIVREARGIDISFIEEIKNREMVLSSLPESEIDRKISLLNSEIGLRESEIRSKEKETEENKKKAEKLKEREKEVLEEIKQEIKKLNLSLKE